MQSSPNTDDLSFTQQDLGREEMVRALERRAAGSRQPAVFAQPVPAGAVGLQPADLDELPWMVRGGPTHGRQGWATRHTELMVRTSETTLRRLRDEAVQVSWKAAWLAVTSADDRLLRKREL